MKLGLFCAEPACTNRARYTSGLCGVCDLMKNGGKGEPMRTVESVNAEDASHPELCGGCRSLAANTGMSPTEASIDCHVHFDWFARELTKFCLGKGEQND